MRLQKCLADAGVASRRKAEGLIIDGRVSVNGQVVRTLGTQAEPGKDTICVDGRPIGLRTVEPIYLMLHKPEGVVTSVSDPHNRPVVIDYVRDINERIFPIGRLDYDTSGLLLLTNDGSLAQTLTHPKFAVPKTYMAAIKGVPTKAEIEAFRKGLSIEGRRTAPAGFTVTQKKRAKDGEIHCLARIMLREGRNRQVRKMCEAIGHPVLQLKRVAVGNLQLGKLPRGAYRRLTPAEVGYLKNLSAITVT